MHAKQFLSVMDHRRYKDFEVNSRAADFTVEIKESILN